MSYHLNNKNMDISKILRDLHPLPPINSVVQEAIEDTTRSIETNSTEEITVKEEGFVNPAINPILFKITRKAVLDTNVLTDFISKRAEKINKASNGDLNNFVDELLRHSMEEDPELISDIKQNLSKIPIDLYRELKDILIMSDLLSESVVALKMLFSIADKDEILSDLILPYLEERAGLGIDKIVSSNKRFYLRFLKALDKKDLRNFIQNVKFQDVIRADNLAYALLEVGEPGFILDSLAKNNNVDLGLPQEEQLLASQKLQACELTVLQKEASLLSMNDSEFLERLETLYSTALHKGVSDEVAKLLSHTSKKDAKIVFLQQLTGEDSVQDVSEENINRRSLAITHLVNMISDYSINAKFLQQFILEENDPSIVSNAVYMLVNNLNQEGKNALAETIVEQAKNEITSIPLGDLSMLYIATEGSAYHDVLRSVFSSDYKDPKRLTKAFENLADEYLCQPAKGNSDFPLDITSKSQNPELVIDLIGYVGLEDYLQWILNDTNEETLKTNSREVLEYACKVNPERMQSIFSWHLANEPNSKTSLLIKKLAGMEQLNQAYTTV